MRRPHPVGSGAVAGAVSAVVFAAVHAVAISDIWFSTVPMVLAGAGCGACLAWSHRRLVPEPSVGSWVRFNLLYVGSLGLLCVASVVLFEPRSTIAELIAADAPPTALIGDALPLTVAFTLVATASVVGLFGGRPRDVAPVLATTSVLVLLLGLNISVLGLVDVPVAAIHLVAELLGLVLLLAAVHTAVYAALELRGAA